MITSGTKDLAGNSLAQETFRSHMSTYPAVFRFNGVLGHAPEVEGAL